MKRKLLISIIFGVIGLGLALWFVKSFPQFLITAFLIAITILFFAIGLNNWQWFDRFKKKVQ